MSKGLSWVVESYQKKKKEKSLGNISALSEPQKKDS